MRRDGGDDYNHKMNGGMSEHFIDHDLRLHQAISEFTSVDY